MFSTRFIAATKEYSTLEKRVPAPYLRRTFEVSGAVKAAKLTVCGLGFYELFINGRRLTKGLIAPYVSNPDDILYYDEYDVTAELRAGRNALGLLLGNGMLNCPGGQIWDLQLTRYRSAPKAALALQIETEGGEKICIEADEAFRCAPSPILYDDLRAGEWYDARREIPGWNLPEFDDGDWSPALPAETPRGECRLCQAEPIVTTHELAPVEVRRGRLRDGDYVHPGLPVIPMEGVEAEKSGWLYDFGVNAAGLCRLKIKGKPGQKIVLQFAETLDENDEVDLRGMSFLPAALDHRDVYICKGEGEEVYTPSFTYHGFRYCLALGLEDEQATPDLLTYQVMNSDLAVRGDFTSSSETLNRLQQATRVSDLANFYYFPTDCPHREKNGWTADAALSAEHMLLNFAVETSYREWLRNICKAQRDDGALPGIVPTAGWGFEWGNGPAWDSVLVYLPYFVWRYRGETGVIRECAASIMRYLNYITTKRDARGLMHIGLGDWCHSAHSNFPKAPLEFTDTVMCMDICRKAAVLFEAAGMTAQRDFARAVYSEFRAAARKYLIDPETMTALGGCQTSQAMAIFYDVFDPAEKPEAARVLVRMIHENDDLMDVGVLGGRVLFRVLSQFGYTDLAFRMVVTDRYPSYGSWIAQGATSLWEDFLPVNAKPNSRNHHFWGDISGWMIECLAGIAVNPHETDCREIELRPHFPAGLDSASAYHILPAGKVSSAWVRKGDEIEWTVEIPDGCSGMLLLDAAWQFDNGCRFQNAASGVYRLLPAAKKDTKYQS